MRSQGCRYRPKTLNDILIGSLQEAEPKRARGMTCSEEDRRTNIFLKTYRKQYNMA